jgi:glucokinase
MTDKYLLAGDIGGTKTLLRVGVWKDGKVTRVREQQYESRQHRSLAEVLSDFLKRAEIRSSSSVKSACFAVAGPVLKQSARLTNLPWRFKTAELQGRFGFDAVRLINDFQGVALGIDRLTSRDLSPVQRGRKDRSGLRAVVGAGTGLGVAWLSGAGDESEVHASEGGHMAFAPQNPLHAELLEFLMAKHGRVSYERVLSGPGLANIFEFLSQARRRKPGQTLVRELARAKNTSTVIGDFAVRDADPVAVEALDIMISIYGAFAGDVALMTVATGGVYIAGGIGPKISAKLKQGEFVQAFTAKGRYQWLLRKMPIYIVMNEKVGLLGAFLLARRELQRDL